MYKILTFRYENAVEFVQMNAYKQIEDLIEDKDIWHVKACILKTGVVSVCQFISTHA